MLDGLRNFAKSGPGKVFGVVLLVGVAGFGINNVIFDLGNSTVARVGSAEITSLDFQRAYQNTLSNFSARFGSVPTPQEAQALGIPGQIIQQLSRDAALDDLANRYGLGVSDAKLGQMLRQDPSFWGTLGTFERERFAQVLRFSGLTEAEYFADQAAAAGREQISAALFAGPVLNETAAQLLARFVGDRRVIDYLVINPISVPSPAAPSDTELASFLAENQAEYRTPETRTVNLLSLSPQSLAATIEVSDEDVAARYEQIADSLAVPERRAIQQVVLTPEQEAVFVQGQAAGRSFDDLVAEAGLTPSQVGTRSQAELTDQTLAQAAFGLEPGQFVIIDGVAGRRAVHVAAIEPGGTPTLEEAREQITTDVATSQARRTYVDVLDQVEELRAAFRPLSEIADRFGLELIELDLTPGSPELAAVADIPADARGRVSTAIFAAEEGELAATVALASTHNVFFELEAVAPPRDLTLDEVRDELTAAWTARATEAAISDHAAQLVERLEAGEALADVALESSQFTQLSQPFTRQGETGTAIDQVIADAVFAGGPDHVGSAVNEQGEHIVFEVVGVTPADPGALDQATRDALAADARRNLHDEFVGAVRDSVGLRINQSALNQVLTQISGQQQ